MKIFRHLKLKQRFMLTLTLVVVILFGSFGSIVYFNRVRTTNENIKSVMRGNLLDLTTLLDYTHYQKGIVSEHASYIVGKTLGYVNRDTLIFDEPVVEVLSQVREPFQNELTEYDIEFLNEKLPKKNYYDTGYPFIVGSDGVLMVHPTRAGESIRDERFFREFSVAHEFGMVKDESFEPGYTSMIYYMYYPLYDLYLAAVAHEEVAVYGPIIPVMRLTYSSLVLAFLIFLFLTNNLANSVLRPVRKINNVLKMLSKGDVTNKVYLKQKDELGEIAFSVNDIIDAFKKTSIFATEIGKGNFDHEFEPLGENDELGKALIDMRISLKEADEQDKLRKQEDQKRNWTAEGLTKFSDILRQETENLEELSYLVVSSIVDYLNANQGGLFILNDEDEGHKFLELTACYAFDRKKFIKKKVELNEGLVGACFMEQKTTHLADIPEDYISITSGLGDANPTNLLLVPLKVNDVIYGVLELASFNQFEPHEIEFVEKVAENIASAISSTKVNQRTAMLLKKSQQQQEEMKAQEEEMRQNMEELQATQEEASRREAMMSNTMKAIDSSIAIMEFDDKGIIINVNRKWEEIFGYSNDEVKGKNHSFLFVDKNYVDTEDYKNYWNSIKSGTEQKYTDKYVAKNGEVKTLDVADCPVYDKFGVMEKIMKFCVDITKYTNK